MIVAVPADGPADQVRPDPRGGGVRLHRGAGQRGLGDPYIYDMDSSLAEQLVEALPAHPFACCPSCGTASRSPSAGASESSRCAPRSRTWRWATRRASRSAGWRTARCSRRRARALATDGLLPEPLRRAGPLAMYVGNLERYQGIDLLLQGFRVTLRRLPSASLVIVGGREDDIQRYREMAAALGIESRVHFLGPRPVRRSADPVAAGRRAGVPPAQGAEHADEDLFLSGLGHRRAGDPAPDPHPGPGRPDGLPGRSGPRGTGHRPGRRS